MNSIVLADLKISSQDSEESSTSTYTLKPSAEISERGEIITYTNPLENQGENFIQFELKEKGD